MDKRIFEMPVRVGGVLWLKDEPYKPFHVIGYRIGRMMGEEEEEWYMQLCGEGEEWSTPVSDIGESFFLTQEEALKARSEE